MSAHTHSFIVKASAATVEVDTESQSAYVRFSRGKVSKTVPIEEPTCVACVDLDSSNNVIGIELVGVKEFGISRLLRLIPSVSAPNADRGRARYISTPQPVHA